MTNVKSTELTGAQVVRFPVHSTSTLRQVFARHMQSAASQKHGCHHTLWSEGECRNYVYFIQTGSVCFFRILPDGRRTVIGFALPGDIIGLGSDLHLFGAETMQPTRLDIMPVAVLHRAVQDDKEFARKIQDEVTRSLIAAYSHIASISKLSAAERLAHFLVDLAERNQRHGLSPNSIVLPMRRVEIADYLGLTIETVSRTFTAFRSAGLIELADTIVVSLKDLSGLTILARGDRDAACILQKKLVA